MRFAAIRMISRFLMVSMLLLPFQTVQAGMIGAGQVASASSAQSDRASVLSIMNRSEVASQLQAMGVDPNAARDRVAAMTDQEVHALAGQLNSLPTGANSGWWIAAVVIIGIVIWYMYYKR